jgi:phage replication initiation protein
VTDWLNCTFSLPDSRESIAAFFQAFTAVVGDRFAPLKEKGKGLHGWERSFTLGSTGALFAIGGQNGKAFLSLPGGACTRVPVEGWLGLVDLLFGGYAATITRWDGAVDDFHGNHSVDWAVEQYHANQFNRGGRRPTHNLHGDWLTSEGAGRTLEVGHRKNGKLIRIYEKGKQLGDRRSSWVRWELELHNKDRVIPWDVVLNPGGYVAGAYPCTAWVTEKACRIRTAKASAVINYDALVYHASQQYGALINVMLAVEGSPENVIDRLWRNGKPARLQIPVPPEFHQQDSKAQGEP